MKRYLKGGNVVIVGLIGVGFLFLILAALAGCVYEVATPPTFVAATPTSLCQAPETWSSADKLSLAKELGARNDQPHVDRMALEWNRLRGDIAAACK